MGQLIRHLSLIIVLGSSTGRSKTVDNTSSFDKRHVTSPHGFELVVEAEKVPTNIISQSNVVCGVSTATFKDANVGDIVIQKNGNKHFTYNLVLKKNKGMTQ